MAAPSAKESLASRLWLYRKMQTIRLCEEQLAKSHQRGLIQGACHTYVGQEAIAVGVCSHLRREDVIFSTHRGHGHALAKGLDPKELIAELYGRQTGCSAGRGGSMHLFAPEIGMMGTSGIVGPCILQAAGAGYSFKLLKTDRVAVAFFGDGAVNNGAFHEGLNMASIWKLSVLFVCENNQFATEVPFNYAAGTPAIAQCGSSYGLPALEVDGNDVLAVQAAAGEAVQRARSGGGPTLLECKTYRTRAHAEGMGDYGYRTRDEVEQWKKLCPILKFREHLLSEKAAEPGELEAIDWEVAVLIEAAEKFAAGSPWPKPATATDHVFSVGAWEPWSVGASEGLSAPVVKHAPTRTLATSSSREITFMKATLEALSEEMARNPRIFVLGEGIGKRGGNFNTTAGLFELYGPERLCDTPICERGLFGLVSCAAMTGSPPVVGFLFAALVLEGAGEGVH